MFEFLYLVFGVTLFAAGFKYGRHVEANEALRLQKDEQRKGEIEGAIMMLSAAYVLKGPDSPDVGELLDTFRYMYPEVDSQWQTLESSDRIRIGKDALLRLGDPEVRNAFTMSENYSVAALAKMNEIDR